MHNQERKILNLLLDTYERKTKRSTQNPAEVCVKKSISSIDSRYLDPSETRIYNEIENAVKDLAEKKYISVSREKNGLLKSIALNLNMVNEIYLILNRKPANNFREMIRTILDSYSNEKGILGSYCSEQIKRIDEGKSIEGFEADFSEDGVSRCRSFLKCVSDILSGDNSLYEREFSVKSLGDSKEFAKIKDSIGRILVKYGGFPSAAAAFECYGIKTNPHEILMKGDAILQIGSQSIDLSVFSSGIGIHEEDVEENVTLKVKVANVITIENLTSFYTFEKNDYFVIYLAGFHNGAKSAFLKNLFLQNSQKQFYHFGDIDLGGFRIFEHLCKDTGIAFKPYEMGVDTLKKHQQSWKPLSNNDIAGLRQLGIPDFSDVVSFMLCNNCKLEQENLTIPNC